MKNKFFILLSMIIAVCSFSACSSSAERPEIEDNTYKIEKINEITDMILQRNAVADSYFLYLDDELSAKISEYNTLTAKLTLDFTRKSMDIVLVVCEPKSSDGTPLTISPLDYEEIPDSLKDITEKITQYALYRNAPELIASDAQIAQIIAGELGGSYGMWHRFIHSGDEFSGTELEDYFNLADIIILELQEYKQNLS